MANKKIETLEADLAQFRSEIGDRLQAGETRMEDLGNQLTQMMTLLTNVANAVAVKVTEGEASDDEDSEKEERSSEKNRGGSEVRMAKVKMPIFDGTDAYGWIYRVERYFEIQGIRTAEQIPTAALCMEEAALAWYRWSKRRTAFLSWDDFKNRLLERFQVTAWGGAIRAIPGHYPGWLSTRLRQQIREALGAVNGPA